VAKTPWVGEALSEAAYSAVELSAAGDVLFVLDQRLLPTEQRYVSCRDVAAVASTIRDMVVRGAPAIGITAAYGMALAARAGEGDDADAYRKRMIAAAAQLRATRPTAVNLDWAVRRCLTTVADHAGESGLQRQRQLVDLSREIHREDVASCRAMGRLGADRLPQGATVLTHCNAGALATGGYGTALGVVRAAWASGKLAGVLACETRPYLQGARLTAWELQQDGIDVTVITDGMVAHCMRTGRVGAVVVGADRIAANGDVANKIGTYGHACLAREHGVPFFVAAPWSTVDLGTAHGDDIVIEQRSREELARLGAATLVPDGVAVYNPAFDVTPAAYVTAIFTERGVFEPEQLNV